MRKALLGIAVLAGAAVAVFIAAVLSVYYAQEKASRAGYYTLHNIDAERGIFSETGDFRVYNRDGTLKVCGGSLCEEGDKTPNQ